MSRKNAGRRDLRSGRGAGVRGPRCPVRRAGKADRRAPILLPRTLVGAGTYASIWAVFRADRMLAYVPVSDLCPPAHDQIE
jgi:hypothetical protein